MENFSNVFFMLFLLMISLCGYSQQVVYEEYDLDNGLHVIIHQDNTAPVVTTSVMYHVGAKDEDPTKTGFAHFFEHLLFEGSKNIAKGDFDKIVGSNGGSHNANTTQDRTYYYETFPSNKMALGLWLESERLMHPIIDQTGVDIQSEVVQEERRLRLDNSPYGQLAEQMYKNVFSKHPYRWTTIGSMEHLAGATLEDFKSFNEKFYVPNNAVLVVAGDIEIDRTKELIEAYFGPIPRGNDIERKIFVEDPITETVKANFNDPNIQIPAIIMGYRTPAQTERDAYILDMISAYLSDGKSSRLYKKMVDEEKTAVQVIAFNASQEDYGMYLIGGLPVGDNTLSTLTSQIDEEISMLLNELISERDFQKLQNKFESRFVNSNSSIAGIANSLARYYMLYDDTNLINSEIEIYRSITREEIMAAVNKYLNPNQRVELDYLPVTNGPN